ncbi:MAG: CPBP family intramembrane metalloprotease [Proteobacteria bacterium]|nr:CPBP family intramembrane metalloprotease [Pseudomonadota bacterium]
MPDRAATPATSHFSPLQALAVFAVVVLLLAAASLPLAWLRDQFSALSAIAAGQLLLIGGIPLSFAALRYGRGWAAALGLGRPKRRRLLGAVLCGASFWYLNGLFFVPIGEELVGGSEALEELEAMVSTAPLVWVLVTLAVIPAAAEEILFRGLLLPALRPGIGTALAVLVSAALFSFFHFSRIQLVPTFAFGLLLGYASVQGNVVVSMLMHLINNTAALLLSTSRLDTLNELLSDHPGWVGPPAALICLTGLTLLHSQPHRQGEN